MAASYVAVGTAMYMITVSRCPPKKNPAANDPPPPRRVLSERHLRLAHACCMLRSSGRSVVEKVLSFQFDLAPQEALRGLGERAFFDCSLGPLEQGPDPGRAAAHHRSQHPSPSCAVLTPHGAGGASCCPMPSTRTLPGRLSSGAGRWGRRSAQKAPHKAAKDPYEPDLLGRLFRLCLTALRRIPTTSAARTGCRGATNGQPNQQAFH